MQKRCVDVAVLSDLHLGTCGCRASEIVTYLKSISPQILILNGDVIDIWQFSKHYFPATHVAVIKEILNLMTSGTRVIYVTGNHDEMLRRYVGFKLGSFKIVNKVLLPLEDGKQAWIFHGDVFDHTTTLPPVPAEPSALIVAPAATVVVFASATGVGERFWLETAPP